MICSADKIKQTMEYGRDQNDLAQFLIWLNLLY